MAKSSLSGELLHAGSVRLRVTGSGFLNLTLNSLDDINSSNLPAVSMATATNREPTVLTNFIDQRMQLIGSVSEIDEYFKISRIIIFVKPVATGYPQ